MDGLRKGEQVWVSAELSNGLDLCREATMNSLTADGQENVILSMPPGSLLVLESVDVQTNDGHTWYKVRYLDEDADVDETGWATGDYLSIGAVDSGGLVIPVTGGPTETTEVDYNGTRKYDVAYLPSDPLDIPQGFVMYKVAGKTRQTSLDEWNATAGRRYKIT